MKKFIAEFKEFISKGNVLDLAIGVVIGGAFTAIVNSLVNDVLMPVIGILTGGLDMSGLFIPLDFQFDQYKTIDAAKAAGVGTLNYGAFLQAIFNFLIIAFCIFMLVKAMSKLLPKKEDEPAKEERKCPFCKMGIHDEATKCPHCASVLPVEETAEA